MVDNKGSCNLRFNPPPFLSPIPAIAGYLWLFELNTPPLHRSFKAVKGQSFGPGPAEVQMGMMHMEAISWAPVAVVVVVLLQ